MVLHMLREVGYDNHSRYVRAVEIGDKDSDKIVLHRFRREDGTLVYQLPVQVVGVDYDADTIQLIDMGIEISYIYIDKEQEKEIIAGAMKQNKDLEELLLEVMINVLMEQHGASGKPPEVSEFEIRDGEYKFEPALNIAGERHSCWPPAVSGKRSRH